MLRLQFGWQTTSCLVFVTDVSNSNYRLGNLVKISHSLTMTFTLLQAAVIQTLSIFKYEAFC